MPQNIYRSGADDPDFLSIKPKNPQKAALYHNDNATQIWVWNVAEQGWKNYVPSGMQQIFVQDAAPVDPPLNPTAPKLVKSRTTGLLYTWDAENSVWI